MRLNSLIGLLFLAILRMSSQTITIVHDCDSNKCKVAIVKNDSEISQILWLIPDNIIIDRMKNFSVKVYNTFIIGTADIWNDYLLAAAWGGNSRRENVK